MEALIELRELLQWILQLCLSHWCMRNSIEHSWPITNSL